MTATSKTDPIDEILGNSGNEPDENESNSNKTDNPSGAGQNNDEKIDWKKRYADSVKGFQEFKENTEKTINELKAIADSKLDKPVVQPQEEVEDLGTTDGWKKHIDKTAQNTVAPIQAELQQFKETQKRKAERLLIQRHPEYKDPAKLKTLWDKYPKVKSRADNDFEEIVEDLEDAWAIDNRKALLEKEQVVKRMQEDREQELAEIASSSGAGYDKANTDDYGLTSKEKAMARQLGKDYKTYRKLLDQLAESEI